MTNVAENRRLWIAALRSEGHRQIHGAYSDPEGGVCALGLRNDIDRTFGPIFDGHGYANVLRDNDLMRLTFAQIADRAEAGRYWDIVEEKQELALAA